MKINRTFSIDYAIARELKSRANQSAFVNAAIVRRLTQEPGVDEDITTAQLMQALHGRDDCDPFVKRCLLTALRALKASQ